MKKIIIFLGTSCIVFVLYYLLYYVLFHYNIDIMQDRQAHHFVAGLYMPYVLFYMTRNQQHLPIMQFGWIYVAVCVLWEGGQSIYFARGIQENQLLFDSVGILVGMSMKRFWVYPRAFFSIKNELIHNS